MIYLFTLQPEGFKELDLKSGETYADNNCLRWAGDEKAETWKSPELIWFNDEFTETSDTDGDFLKFRGGAPILSAKAYSVLQPVIKDSAEFLPVWVDNEKRYLLNVTTIVDLIDKSKEKTDIEKIARINF